MRRYQHVERSQAIALDDVATLQSIAKQRIVELKNLAKESDSLLVSSIVRSTCIDIDRSIDDAIKKARNLLSMFQ